MAAKRACAKCGKEKELEGGKVCEKGHFVCKACVGHDGFLSSASTKCPVCKTKLS